jgi:hypothetical protein
VLFSLPKRYERSKLTVIGIFLSFFLLPIVSYFLFTFLFIIVLRLQKGELKISCNQIPIEEITLEEIKATPRRFGESALRFFLDNPLALREDSLFLLKDIDNPIALEVAKRALSHPVDEVRLTAFSIIYRLEKKINERIDELKKQFYSTKPLEKKSLLAKEIAQAYWELLYFNLVDEELRPFLIREAIYWAEEALKGSFNPEVMLLVGKIFLKFDSVDKAYPFLLKAYNFGDSVIRNQVIPYLAEAEFYRGNLKRVKEVFKELPFSLYPDITFMKYFWIGEKVE